MENKIQLCGFSFTRDSIVKENVKRDGILECDYTLIMAMPRDREHPDTVAHCIVYTTNADRHFDRPQTVKHMANLMLPHTESRDVCFYFGMQRVRPDATINDLVFNPQNIGYNGK